MISGKKIIVSVNSDLITDQRVHKVCTTLADAGYDVSVIGRKFSKDKHPLNRNYKTKRIRLMFNRSILFFAEFNIRLFFCLLFSKADVFLSNDTDSLIPNYLISKVKHKPLVFDAHEMYPEVPEVINRKFVKLVWTKIEDWIFPKLKYSYTVCQSIADIYNKRYPINMQVIRNIPFALKSVPNKKQLDTNGKHILLYQGAVNRGRGIEWIIDTMPLLDEFIFYIAGDGEVMPNIKEKIQMNNLEDRIKLLGKIPFEELPSYTACADIGISLLESKSLNYYYSLPNRIFDFIQLNIPILASDFPEINRIISHYDVGELVSHYEPEYLASVIRQMIDNKKDIKQFIKANAELSWEKESQILLNIINQAIEKYN